MSDTGDLQESIEAIQSILLPLKEGEFSKKLNKVSMYLSAIERSWNIYNSSLELARQLAGSDQEKYNKAIASRTNDLRASAGSSVKFARMNLDLAMAQALDKLVRRPRSANKVDEGKRMQSLGEWFDQLSDPSKAMIEHFKTSSNPLDKWLVAGQWGHQYIKKRHLDLVAYDRELCELIACSDSAAVEMVLSYSNLCQAIDAMAAILKIEDLSFGNNKKVKDPRR
jgi:hypothetical protein